MKYDKFHFFFVLCQYTGILQPCKTFNKNFLPAHLRLYIINKLSLVSLNPEINEKKYLKTTLPNSNLILLFCEKRSRYFLFDLKFVHHFFPFPFNISLITYSGIASLFSPEGQFQFLTCAEMASPYIGIFFL